MNTIRCRGPPIPPPEFPPTLVVSCREVERPMPLEPMRSTFCYENTSANLTAADIIDRRKQWDTFERVENYNSAILNQLGETVPKPQNGERDGSVFYNFANQKERNDYLAGQRAHVRALPNVNDFVVPYANKPIPYTSSVISTLATVNPQMMTGPCPNERPGKPISYEELISNRKGLSIYIKVSTQTGLYPKSPYKFKNTEEYLMYKKYVNLNC